MPEVKEAQLAQAGGADEPSLEDAPSEAPMIVLPTQCNQCDPSRPIVISDMGDGTNVMGKVGFPGLDNVKQDHEGQEEESGESDLEAEVEDLKADQEYVEFLQGVLAVKEPAEETNPEGDPDWQAEEIKAEGIHEEEENEQQESSESSDEEDDPVMDAKEEAEECLPVRDLAVPEGAGRNPLLPKFWRTAYQMRKADEASGYKSDEDPDFDPDDEERRMEEERQQESSDEDDGDQQVVKEEVHDEMMVDGSYSLSCKAPPLLRMPSWLK